MKIKFIFYTGLVLILGVSNLRALTIQEALDLTMKNNPAISIAKNSEKAQKYKLESLEISRFGEATAIGNFTTYNYKRTLTPMVPPIKPPFPLADDNITNIGGTYTLPLFTGFKLSRNISIASLNYEIAKNQSSLTEKQIKFNVYSIFLKGLSLKEQLQARQHQEKALEELHKKIELGTKVGRYAPIDLKKVDYQLEMVKAQIKTLEGNITALKAAMDQMTGMTSDDWDFEPINTEDENFPSLEDMLKLASLNREEMKIATEKKQIAEANYSKAKNSYFPDIVASYTYLRSYGGGGNVPLWNYSVMAQFPVFDFGKRIFEMSAQKQEFKNAQEAQTAQALAVRKEVIEAYSNRQTQLEIHQANQKALEYAKEAKDVEELKYQQGVGSIYDFLLAIAQYYDALAQERSSYYGILIANKYLKLTYGEKI